MTKVSSVLRESREDNFDRFTDAMRHIISVPKAEIDKRAKAWAKRRRSRKRP